MPWLGFYSKIAKSDIWVILDHVENNPRHKGYWNRVAILVQEKFFWISTKHLDKTIITFNPVIFFTIDGFW